MSWSNLKIETTHTARYSAHIGHLEIARIEVDEDTGVIFNVWVHNRYRRRGVATYLYSYVSGIRKLYHDIPAHRSDDGERWAHRVGGETWPGGCVHPQCYCNEDVIDEDEDSPLCVVY